MSIEKIIWMIYLSITLYISLTYVKFELMFIIDKDYQNKSFEKNVMQKLITVCILEKRK